MALIPNIYKAQLGELLAKGHAKFGPVAARRAYKDEDDEGGGAAGLSVETHPMFMNVPEGAASDLTFIASDNSEITDEALGRVEELTYELKNQPAMQPGAPAPSTPKPSPY